MLQLKPTVNIYKSLKEAKSITQSWTDERSFNLNRASVSEQQFVFGLCGIEIDFGGAGQNNQDLDILFKRFEWFVKSLITLNDDNDHYLHTTEYGIQPKSRIRSFKKYISEKDFPINSVIQTEIDFANNQSIFAGSIQMDTYTSKLMNYFFDNLTSFILLKKSESTLNLIETFKSVIMNSLQKSGSVILDFVKVLCTYCKSGDSIYRVGGDNGIESLSLHIFTSLENLDYYSEITRKSLSLYNKTGFAESVE